MKAYNLALFFLILQVSALTLAYSGVFPNCNNAINGCYIADNEYVQNYNQQNVKNATGLSGLIDRTEGGAIWKSLSDFMNMATGLFRIDKTFMGFGMPEYLAITLAIPIYFIWAAAVVQFFRNTNFDAQA